MDMTERQIVEWGREQFWHGKIQDYRARYPGLEAMIDEAAASLKRQRILSFDPDGTFHITNHGIKVMGWDGPF